MTLTIIQRVLAIVGLGVCIGAADSWLRPVRLTLAPTVASPAAATRADASTPASSPGGATPAASTPAASMPAASRTPTPSDATGASPSSPSEAALGLMIDSRAAKGLLDQGVIFLDARLRNEFDEKRIEGAYHLTTSTISGPEGRKVLDTLSREDPVVIYCGGGDCDASKNLAVMLQGIGFTRLHIIENGFPEWVALGYPVESGAGGTP